jgi:hypothetical protein
MMLKKLRKQQIFDLLQRLWHRVDDFMIKAVSTNGNMIGKYKQLISRDHVNITFNS